MKIGIISDTHGHMDERIVKHLSDCDQIWHAGDIGDIAVCDVLEKIAPLKAVFGNIDDHKIRLAHPLHQQFICEEKKIFITHIAGRTPTYNAEVLKQISAFRPDILVCGHSHILKVMNDPKNKLLYINPGAAGRKGFHKVRTLIRLNIKKGEISKLEVIELGPRASLD